MNVFIDSSVWFAVANTRERRNVRAKQLLAEIEPPLLTDHVLVETWLLLNSRINRRAAEEFWRGMRMGAAEIEKATTVDLERALMIGEFFPDQDFSIVDRTSFAVMERLGLTRAASLDDDFAIYRYGRMRDKAFEIFR